MRKLVSLEEFIENLKSEGIETSEVFLDPNDAVEIPDLDTEE